MITKKIGDAQHGRVSWGQISPGANRLAGRLISLDDLRKRGVIHSAIQIRRWEKANTFPKRVKIGRRNHWVESEIDAWMEACIAGRDRGWKLAIVAQIIDIVRS